MYHDDRHAFPGNGGWDGQQSILSTDGTPTYVYTQDAVVDHPFYWGVGDPNRTGADQTGSWAFALLPYVEQQNMFDARTWTDPVKLYICPSRRLAVALPAQDDAHASYSGGGWKWGKTDYAANAFVVPNRGLAPLVASPASPTGRRTPSSPVRRPMDPVYCSHRLLVLGRAVLPRRLVGTSRKGNGLRPRPAGRLRQARDELGFGASGRGQFPLLRRLRPSDRLRHVAADHSALMTPAGGEVVPDF